MYTLYQFNLLPEKDKPVLLWQDGVFLDRSREENGFKIVLYALYSFYVEVWYKVDENEIVKLRTFKSLKQLSCYL